MFWRRRRSDRDFAEEIRSHLELEQCELREEGAGEDGARAARRTFGNVTAAQERFHERGRLVWIEGAVKDFLFALRMIRRRPWFAAVAVIVMATTIGSTLAIFNVIDALLLKPVAVAHPEELMQISGVDRAGELNGLPSLALEPLRAESAFRGVCGFDTPRLPARIAGAVRSIGTLLMTSECFSTLGLDTQIGRPFTEADDRSGTLNVAVLTDGLWRSAFGGRPDVLGKPVEIDGEPYTIIGVAGKRFEGLLAGFPPGLIVPLRQQPGKPLFYYWVRIFARRAPGVSERQARARIQTIQKQLLEQSVPQRYNASRRREYLNQKVEAVSAEHGIDSYMQRRFGKYFYALFGVCVAVLLAGCVNLMSLLLARGMTRQREIAVRMAIGGSRWRVVRGMSAENGLLLAVGVAGGLVLADWASRWMIAGASEVFTGFAVDAALSSRSLLLAAASALAMALFFALGPVWLTRGAAYAAALKENARGIAARASLEQKILIGVQLAFTLALVVSAGLFGSSFQKLTGLDLGFRVGGLSEARLSPLPGGYNGIQAGPYYAALRGRIEALPGVASASFSNSAPLWNMPPMESVSGETGGTEVRARIILASDRYFETLGVRLVSGEDFSRVPGAIPEAVISESMASQLGEGVGVGRYIRMGDGAAVKRYRVIGVAPRMKLSLADPLETDPLAVYLNFWQDPAPQRRAMLLVRARGNGAPAAAPIRGAVQSLGREYVEEYWTAEQTRNSAIVEDRLLAYWSGAFAGLALGLAAIGLFALLSGYVAGRRSEIGIRMALGADRASIRRLVLRQIGPMMAIGMIAGLAVAIGVGRLLASIAYGLAPYDPRLLAFGVAALIVVAIPAVWIPARRAASVDPLEALRQD